MVVASSIYGQGKVILFKKLTQLSSSVINDAFDLLITVSAISGDTLDSGNTFLSFILYIWRALTYFQLLHCVISKWVLRPELLPLQMRMQHSTCYVLQHVLHEYSTCYSTCYMNTARVTARAT